MGGAGLGPGGFDPNFGNMQGGGFKMAPPAQSTTDLSPKEFNDPKYAGSTPGLRNIFAAMFGGSANQGQFGDWSGVGGLFGGNDPLEGTRNALAELNSSGGIVDLPPELQKALANSNKAYDRDQPGAIGYNDWFGIGDPGGAGGSVLNRAMGDASRFGWRDDRGNPIDTQSSSPMQQFLAAQQAAQNGEGMEQKDYRNEGERYVDMMHGKVAQPGARDTANKLATGVFGQATSGNEVDMANALSAAVGDKSTVGSQSALANSLASAVGGLNNQYESGLMSDIDTEAQRSLGMQLPEVQAQMQLAGLGRSGANQMAQGQLARDVLGQANRDKQRILGQFAETGRGLSAQALGQGAGQIGQSMEGSAGREVGALGQGASQISQALQGDAGRNVAALGQGAGILGQAQMNDANMVGQSVLGAQGLAGQGLQNANQRYGLDQGNLANMILGLEDARTKGLGSESASQAQALSQYMDMFGLMKGTQSQDLQQLMQLAMSQRSTAQDAMNQRIQAAMLPWQTMLTIGTGTTSGGYQTPQASPNPWAGAAANVGGNIISSALGGGVSPYQGTFT
jgi:hypothetical protein